MTSKFTSTDFPNLPKSTGNRVSVLPQHVTFSSPLVDKLNSVGERGIKELDPGDGNPDMNSGLNTKDDEMVIGLESQEGIAEEGIIPSKGECVPDSGGIVADEAMELGH